MVKTRRITRHYQIGESVDELSEGETIWPDDIKANAGVLIGIDPKGEPDSRRDLIRGEGAAKVGNGAPRPGKWTMPLASVCPPRS